MSQVQGNRHNVISSAISGIAAYALRFSPTAWFKSWLLYLGVQTHVRGTIDPELKPLHNVCEYLNALHIYTDEARRGVVRTVDAHHFCAHVGKDLRQCLIYDSSSTNARLIGVEYLIPRSRYLSLPPLEQRFWHSHNFEVKCGMLILPYPTTHASSSSGRRNWDALEKQALSEVVGWYGKLYHFWQVDRGDELPLGEPRLMGSLTSSRQTNVDEAMKERNRALGVDMGEKRRLREGIDETEVVGGADEWWREAEREQRGIYAAAETATGES